MDLKRRSMRNALGSTMSLLDDGRMRGFTAADIFGAYAQIVANQSPTVARKSFEALEKVIQSRAILPVGAYCPRCDTTYPAGGECLCVPASQMLMPARVA